MTPPRLFRAIITIDVQARDADDAGSVVQLAITPAEGLTSKMLEARAIYGAHIHRVEWDGSVDEQYVNPADLRDTN